ncbi:unnamed protein product [Psylliodes chrysocephalus]|uniref:SAM domain-containing protein n=1 Tax=Psylliodes chrysocephalus TaxID=3402493 RepID=A0A9P0CV91_9CUCU|nr:unnamed protein product [Psylliodes chrysocephala]
MCNMEAYLETWGLTSLILVFKEQGISEDSLFLLTEDNIKEIIPPIGPRLKILKQIQEHKEQEKQFPIIVDELPSVSTNSEFSVSSNATMEDNIEIETELENLFNESTQPASLSSLQLWTVFSAAYTGSRGATQKQNKTEFSFSRGNLSSLICSFTFVTIAISCLKNSNFESISVKDLQR